MVREPREPKKQSRAPEPQPGSENNEEHQEAKQLRDSLREAFQLLTTSEKINPQTIHHTAEKLIGMPLSDESHNWNDLQSALDRLLAVACASPFRINNIRVLSNEGNGKGFSLADGTVLYEQNNKKLVADWSAEFQQQHPKIVKKISASLQEEMSKLTYHSDPCYVYLKERGGIVVINIDAGRHKESMTLIPDNAAQAIAIYDHAPSKQEVDTPKKYRAAYINDALQGIPQTMQIKKDTKGTVKAIMKGNTSFLAKQLFRLALSTKDLDLMLSNNHQVDCATQWFRQGATNIHIMCTLASADQPPTSLEKNTPLAPQEIKILTEIFQNRKDMEKYQKRIQQQLDAARRIREINYRALATIEKLRAMAFDEIPHRPGEMRRLFSQCVEDIHEMRRTIPVLEYTCTDEGIDTLAAQFAGAIDVLDYTFDSIISDNTQRTIRNAQATVLDMINDTPEQLESWDQVTSLNQAIRYLHRRLYTISSRFGKTMEDRLHYSGDPLLPEPNPQFGVTVIDVRTVVNSQGPSAIAQQTLKQIRPLHESPLTGLSEKPLLIAGDNYVEIRAAAGKHLIELLAEYDEREMTVSFRLVESGYVGSNNRLSFARSVLQEAGFVEHTEQAQQGRWLQMHIKTESPERWRHGLQSAVRLVHTLPDMDLGNILPAYTALFAEGATHLRITGGPLVHLKQSTAQELMESQQQAKEKMRSPLSMVVYFGDSNEHRLLVQILLSKLKGPVEWRNICTTLSTEEREKIVSTLLDMEDEATQHKDKATARRLRSRADAIINTL